MYYQVSFMKSNQPHNWMRKFKFDFQLLNISCFVVRSEEVSHYLTDPPKVRHVCFIC